MLIFTFELFVEILSPIRALLFTIIILLFKGEEIIVLSAKGLHDLAVFLVCDSHTHFINTQQSAVYHQESLYLSRSLTKHDMNPTSHLLSDRD
jgi:hypothetical protein